MKGFISYLKITVNVKTDREYFFMKVGGRWQRITKSRFNAKFSEAVRREYYPLKITKNLVSSFITVYSKGA